MLPSQVQQPAVTYQQQDQDSPYEVVNVAAVHQDPVEGSNIVGNQAYEASDAGKGDQERYRREETAAPGTIRNGGANEQAQPGEVEQNQQQNDDQRGKGQQHDSAR